MSQITLAYWRKKRGFTRAPRRQPGNFTARNVRVTVPYALQNKYVSCRTMWFFGYIIPYVIDFPDSDRLNLWRRFGAEALESVVS